MEESAALFVPISIEAMVVNEQVRKEQPFRRFQMAYSSMDEFLSPEAPVFGGGQEDFQENVENEGVYLHWTLPKALRRSKQDDTGADVFPIVPNRWLVVRLSGLLTQRSAAAWVVESDYLDPETGTSPFVDPFTQKRTLIGRKLPLSGAEPWSETGREELFLTSIGAGNLTFSAFQPNVENVFSLHDPLSAQGIDKDTLSYFVAGWYSNPEQDLLSGWKTAKEYLQLLQDLNWEVEGDVLWSAKRTLYHGMVYGVNWDRFNCGQQPLPAVRTAAPPAVAVGNTSTEAFAALVGRIAELAGGDQAGQADRESAAFLRALQYQMLSSLDHPDAQETLEQRGTDSAFRSEHGGLVWTIVDCDEQQGREDRRSDEERREDERKEEQLLAELNTKQSELDWNRRYLYTLQRRLYEMWWKDGRAKALEQAVGNMPHGTSRGQFDGVFDLDDAGSLVRQVCDQMCLIRKLEEKVPTETAQQTLEQSAEQYGKEHGLPEHRRLKAQEMPRFWTAQDPVVLLAGLPYPKDAQGVLSVRFPAHTVTEFTFVEQDVHHVISVDDLHKALPKINLAPLPKEIRGLYGEFFMLDPFNSEVLAGRVADNPNVDLISRVFAAMEARKDYHGIVPSIGVKRWEQPWEPLFLEWHVNWHPLPYLSENGSRNWQFDGKDYVCSHKDPRSKSIQVIKGRTLLTPQATSTFRMRLEQFLREHSLDTKLVEKINEFLSGMEQWNVLSQMLSGFSQQLALRSYGTHLIPQDDDHADQYERMIAKLVGRSSHLAPIPGRAVKPPFTVEPLSDFQAVRSGQFCFQRLLVVDRFGQTYDVIHNQDEFCPQVHPVVSAGLKPDPDCLAAEDSTCSGGQEHAKNLVQLRPRVLQGSRLHFHWVSADDDQALLNLKADVHPVYGWILPNHLERGLSVYDRDGVGLGTMVVIKPAVGICKVEWIPVPNSPYPDLDHLERKNKHLYKFLVGLKEAGEWEFSNFLFTIDSTLWAVDPLGEREDQNLSVLIGRPIPLVRAKLKFELEGMPLEDPSWFKTFQKQYPDLLDYPFSIRLGDLDMRRDGMLGYYIEENYSRFHAVYDQVDSDYVLGIGSPDPKGQPNYLTLRMHEDSEIHVTLLMVPHARVHAYTGLLPVKTLELPKKFIEPVLAKMQVHFHAGPLLTNRATVRKTECEEDKSVIVPVPNVQSGKWSWMERCAPDDWKVFEILHAGQKDAPTTLPPTLREGLLKLSEAMREAEGL